MMPKPSFSCIRPSAVAFAAAMLASCATTPKPPRSDDPWEGFNRKMYAFNDFADRVAIRPVAVGYRKVTNDTSRRLIGNFFSNIKSPITIVNDLLQGEGKLAAAQIGRLMVNTTIGVLGLFDPATSMGVNAQTTDFGVTLAKWGVPEGPYLVLPLLGSSSLRDAGAFPVDIYFLDPLAYYSRTRSLKYHAEFLPQVAYLVTLRSSAIEAEGLVQGAYDPYIFFRDAYRQRRLYKIYNGNPPQSAVEALRGGDENIDFDQLLREQSTYRKEHNLADPDRMTKPQ